MYKRQYLETYRLTADLITFLDEKLAPIDTMSGVLMSVYGLGVMILGESGMGTVSYTHLSFNGEAKTS